MAVKGSVEFPLTKAGIARALVELEQLDATLYGEGDGGEGTAASPLTQLESVYRSTGEGTRTRELLDRLPGGISKALTPAEIGGLLTPNQDGSPLTPGQVRAVMRNEKRIENTLRKRGTLPEGRVIVRADWSRYDAEGSGRYYVTSADRRTLDGLA